MCQTSPAQKTTGSQIRMDHVGSTAWRRTRRISLSRNIGICNVCRMKPINVQIKGNIADFFENSVTLCHSRAPCGWIRTRSEKKNPRMWSLANIFDTRWFRNRRVRTIALRTGFTSGCDATGAALPNGKLAASTASLPSPSPPLPERFIRRAKLRRRARNGTDRDDFITRH